jgi:autotransporter-associated beta strand protein
MASERPSFCRPHRPVIFRERIIVMFIVGRRARLRCGRPLGYAVFLALVAASTPAARAQYATAIAVSGFVAPDTGGDIFAGTSTAFELPTINSFGQVAFAGITTRGSGIFLTTLGTSPTTGTPQLPGSVPLGSLKSVAISAAPAPVADLPVTNNTGFYSTFGADKITLNDGNGNTNGGQVAFRVIVNDNPIPLNGNHLESIFALPPGLLSTQAYQGGLDQANVPPSLVPPFTTVGTTHSTWSSIPPFSGPAQNEKNLISFSAAVNDAASGVTVNGIFVGPVPQVVASPPTAVQMRAAAIDGSPLASGSGINGVLQGFQGTVALSPTVNTSTTLVVFQAGTTDSNHANGIFAVQVDSNTGAPLTNPVPVAFERENVATPAGTQQFHTQFWNISTTRQFSVSDFNGGQVAFKADMNPNGGSSPGPGDSGIFVWTPGGSPTVVAYTRSPAPLGPTGTNAYSVLYPNGQFPPSSPYYNPADPTVHYVEFTGEVAQSNAGRLAFVSTLTPGGGGGVFLTSAGGVTVEPVALTGNPAPGAGTGVNYGGFFIGSDPSIATAVGINTHSGRNGSPEVAFIAALTGAGVNSTNNQGLFLANDQILPSNVHAANIHLTETAMLARIGDQIQIAPGVYRTITGFNFFANDGNGSAGLNQFGQLAAQVTYNDSQGFSGQGVYVFTPDLHLSPFTNSTTTVAPTWGGTGSEWTFGYKPSDGLYRVVIDPTDVNVTNTAAVVVNVAIPGNSTVPALSVGGTSGVVHVTTTGAVTLGSGNGAADGLANTPYVLTIRGGSNAGGSTDITGTGTITFHGDVRSLAGTATATIATGLDLGNVTLPAVPVAPLPAAPPSTADADRFRTFNVDRGNFVGSNPVDLLISGVISSASVTGTVPVTGGSTTTANFTNSLPRGILKTGDGTLRLTGANTFGPSTTSPTQTIGGTAYIDPYGPNIEVIRVTGGELSFNGDASSIGAAAPLGVVPTVVFPRWLVLNGGALQLQTSGVSTVSNPTVLNINRGISLGPVTGFGNGTIDVFGTNALSYAGVIADNTDGVTTGVGSLTKTGTGTLILTGANTYRGGTIVNQGTLQATSDSPTAVSSLGAPGTPVAVNGTGTLLYTASVTTARPFTMSPTGTLAVAAGQTVTFSSNPAANGNPTVQGGLLTGPGSFATSPNDGWNFVGGVTSTTARLTLNGADTVTAFNQGGQLTVLSGVNDKVTLTNVNNLGSGTITIGSTTASGPGSALGAPGLPGVDAVGFQSSGVLVIANAPNGFANANRLNNANPVGATPLDYPMYFNAGSRTTIGPAFSAGTGAVLDLHGNDAIVAGGLFVNNGAVFDSLATGTSHATIIADYGAKVEGIGLFQFSPITQNGGVFKPGLCPGQASFGQFQFGHNGVDNYLFYISNATGTAGPTPDAQGYVSGWSLIKTVQQVGPTTATGDFAWNADSAHLLKIALDTLVNPTMIGTDVAGPMDNFDPTQPYAWPAVEWSGNYTGPTSAAVLDASTVFDTTGFVNSYAGSFGWNLDTGNQTLYLTYTPVPEPGTIALVGAAGLGLAWLRRRRR